MSSIFKILFICFGLLGMFQTNAKKFSLNDAQWWRGQVVLEEEDTLNTLFQYNTETNSLRIKDSEGNIKIYSPKVVTSFSFNDPNWKQKRIFETFLYTKKVGGYETPMFFEILVNGKKMSCFMRENYNASAWLNVQTLSKPFADYFLQTADGSIYLYRGSTKDLIKLMEDRKEEMETFIKKNKLNTDLLGDLLRIVAYYNRI